MEKKKKKMSNKEVNLFLYFKISNIKLNQIIISQNQIYRILAFEFAEEDSTNLKVSLISEMVSNLFYPNEEGGTSRTQFKNLIEKAFSQYSSGNGEISEDQFCKAMVILFNNIQTTYIKFN